MMADRERSRSPRSSSNYSDIVHLVVAREQARAAKDFTLGDSLRERLQQMGVQLFDKTNSWRSSDGQTGRIPTWSDIEAGTTADSLITQQDSRTSMMMGRADAPEGSEAHIKYLVQQREQARASKDWGQSDTIRDQLKGMGVDIFDKDKMWKSKSGFSGVIMGYRGASGPSDLEVSTLVVQREKARQNSDFTTADMIRDELRAVGIEINDREKSWRSNDGRQGPVPTWTAIMGGAPAPQQMVPAQPALMMAAPPVQPAQGGNINANLRNQVVQAALAAAQNPASAARTLQILNQASGPQPPTSLPPRAAARPMPTPALPPAPAPRGAVNQEAQEGIEFINQCKAGARIAQDSEIEWLVSIREKCRQNKDFSSADELRNHMRSSLGVELYEREKKWVASDGRQGAIPMWGSLVV